MPPICFLTFLYVVMLVFGMFSNSCFLYTIHFSSFLLHCERLSLTWLCLLRAPLPPLSFLLRPAPFFVTVILSFRLIRFEFVYVAIVGHAHKSASYVRYECVSVTELLMEYLAECYKLQTEYEM